MRNYDVSTFGLVPHQGKKNTFYDTLIFCGWEMVRCFRWTVRFFLPLTGTKYFSLLRIKYFFSISSTLNWSCLLYTVAICTLYFRCFIDIFFCMFGISSSQLPFTEWLSETRDSSISWEVSSDPEIWPKRINETIKHLKDDFNDAPLLRKTILDMWASKCYFTVGEKFKDTREILRNVKNSEKN